MGGRVGAHPGLLRLTQTPPPHAMRYFLAGNDTAVGKTWIGVRLVRALRAAGAPALGFKPVACGDRADAVAYLDAAGPDSGVTLDQINPWFYQAPAAPYTAAILEDRALDFATLDAALAALESRGNPVIIEGAGGLMTPLARDETMRGLARRWNCPVLLVVENRLGALTQALACAECLHAASLPLEAVILNRPPPSAPAASAGAPGLDLEGLMQSNFAVLEERLPGRVFHGDNASLAAVAGRLLGNPRPP